MLSGLHDFQAALEFSGEEANPHWKDQARQIKREMEPWGLPRTGLKEGSFGARKRSPSSTQEGGSSTQRVPEGWGGAVGPTVRGGNRYREQVRVTPQNAPPDFISGCSLDPGDLKTCIKSKADILVMCQEGCSVMVGVGD